MIFKWRESFSVNNPEIDEQHKKLFEIGTRIYNVASLDDSIDHYDEIMEILQELKDYTVYHFDYEEKKLEECGFNELDVHRVEHAFFIKKIDRIGRKNIDNEQGETIIEVVKFVADWVTSHILKSDMKYSAFLKG